MASMLLILILSIFFVTSNSTEQKQNNTRRGKIKPRIVGGENTFLNEFPFMVDIKNALRDTICGGALINEHFVVTAAHCFPGVPLNFFYIYLGDYDAKDEHETPHVEVKIEKIITHPGYDFKKKVHDIALLKLSKSVSFTKAVSPVCLSLNDGEDYTGWLATVSGWGRTQHEGQSAQILKKLRLSVLSNNVCQSAYWPIQVIDQSHLCAHETYKDACNGDSGGPFTVYKKGSTVLIGVVAFGIQCGKQNKPTVFTRISSYVAWIQGNIEGTSVCLV